MSWTENKWLKPAWMGENNDFVNKYQDKFAKIGEKFAPQVKHKEHNELASGIEPPIILESRKGATNPEHLHDLANTYYSGDQFKKKNTEKLVDENIKDKGFVFRYVKSKNKKKGQYYLRTTFLIVYCPLFFRDPENSGLLGGPLEKENPKVFREVEAHERYGHVPQIMEAVRQEIAIDLDLDGKKRRYNGTAPQILTQYTLDLYEVLDAKIAARIANEGDKMVDEEYELTEEEVNEGVQKRDEREQSLLKNAEIKLINKLIENINTYLYETIPDKETDANRRAKAKLGGDGNVRYLQKRGSIKWHGQPLI